MEHRKDKKKKSFSINGGTTVLKPLFRHLKIVLSYREYIYFRNKYTKIFMNEGFPGIKKFSLSLKILFVSSLNTNLKDSFPNRFLSLKYDWISKKPSGVPTDPILKNMVIDLFMNRNVRKILTLVKSHTYFIGKPDGDFSSVINRLSKEERESVNKSLAPFTSFVKEMGVRIPQKIVDYHFSSSSLNFLLNSKGMKKSVNASFDVGVNGSASNLLMKFIGGVRNDPFPRALNIRSRFVQSLPNGTNCPNIGHITQFAERGGKTRTITVPGPLVKFLMSPYEEGLKMILKGFKSDYSLDHEGGALEVSRRLKTTRQVYSLDLSAATDRMPNDFLRAVWYAMVEAQGLDKSYKVLCDLSTFPVLSRDRLIAFSAGQPMGLPGSFRLFSITHHLLVWWVHRLKGLKGRVTEMYLIVGDDIVFFDKGLSIAYKDMITSFGVEISLTKSLTGTVGEFTSFLITKNGIYKPIKVPLFLMNKSTKLALSNSVNLESVKMEVDSLPPAVILSYLALGKKSWVKLFKVIRPEQDRVDEFFTLLLESSKKFGIPMTRASKAALTDLFPDPGFIHRIPNDIPYSTLIVKYRILLEKRLEDLFTRISDTHNIDVNHVKLVKEKDRINSVVQYLSVLIHEIVDRTPIPWFFEDQSQRLYSLPYEEGILE